MLVLGSVSLYHQLWRSQVASGLCGFRSLCPHRRWSCSRFFRRKSRVKKIWGGIWRRDWWNRSSFKGYRYIIHRYIDKKKSFNFNRISIVSTSFNGVDVVLSFNQISIISTIPTGVPGSFPLFNCQDIWMIFATPRKRSKVFSRRPTWMAQARGLQFVGSNQSSGWWWTIKMFPYLQGDTQSQPSV